MSLLRCRGKEARAQTGGLGRDRAMNEETDICTSGWSSRWMNKLGWQMCGRLERSDQILGGLVGGWMAEQMNG